MHLRVLGSVHYHKIAPRGTFPPIYVLLNAAVCCGDYRASLAMTLIRLTIITQILNN